MKEHKFKFSDNVDYNALNGRDILYLDSNVWIDLADEKTDIARTLKDLLIILVKDKKIFCPLNFPTLTELYKQEYDSMLRVGELMNQLSLNFSFSRSEDIWSYEVVRFIFSHLDEMDYNLNNKILFIPFIGYLSASASLIFPDDYDDKLEKNVYELLTKTLSKTTLPEFIKISEGFKNRRQKDLAYKIQNEWNNRWDRNNGNRKKIRIEMENIIAKEKLLPLIKKVNSSLEPNQMIKLLNYIDSFPKDNQERAFNSIIKHMPSLRNEVDLLSIVQLDRNRKITMNDFFDLENIPIPLAYSKYFVARDKWIRHLFNSTNLPEINDCEYFYDLNELLNSLTNSYLK